MVVVFIVNCKKTPPIFFLSFGLRQGFVEAVGCQSKKFRTVVLENLFSRLEIMRDTCEGEGAPLL